MFLLHFFCLGGSVGDFSSEPVCFPLGIFIPKRNWKEDDVQTSPQVQCNEALSICGEVQAQFAKAPLATNYELFWDAGTGSLPDILVYTGSLPSADIAISSQTCYQFRVRGTTSDGMSDFGEIRSVSLSMLAAPSGLKIQEIRGGAVTLSWAEIISSCVGWYEVEIFNVAFGYTWILKSGLPEIRVDDLRELYFSFLASLLGIDSSHSPPPGKLTS